MDPSAVHDLLVASYHPDPNVQKQAELSIEQLSYQAGFLPLLLQIQASEQLELEPRQAAAICFKNNVVKSWTAGLSSEDKDTIKRNILGAFITAAPVIQTQLDRSLKEIISKDFPQQWPTFMSELEQLLTSDDARHICVGLIGLQSVVELFKWKVGERREPLLHIMALTFPTIINICSKLMDSNTNEVAQIIKLSLRIYYSCTEAELPVYLQESSILVSWCTFFVQVVSKQIPNEIQPQDVEEREHFIWWKAKKWAYKCLNHLFAIYGNPAMLPTSFTQYTEFAESFIANYAPNILQAYLMQIDGWIKREHWMSSKCLALSANFFDDSIKHSTTWKIIKPYTEVLITHFVFPQLRFSSEDEQLWQEDAVEFVHKKFDPIVDVHLSAESRAVSLLKDLAKHRTSYTFDIILGFVNNVLKNYSSTPENQRDARDKDGALCMIGALARIILDNDMDVANDMESFFTTHVFSEFQSNHPFLRARACEITRQFSNLEITEMTLGIIYRNVLLLLKDTELPVRIQAALAMQPLIKYESVQEAIVPDLPFVMQEFLNLTNEIDLDILAKVMEEFVEVFSDQLTPFAAQLCTQLRDSFVHIMGEPNTQQTNADATKESSDKTMAAIGVLKTMSTFVLRLEGANELLPQLEQILYPVIQYTLEGYIFELYEEVFELVDACTFTLKSITSTMWNAFEVMYKVFPQVPTHQLSNMMSALENYFTYGSSTVASNAQVQKMMYEIAEVVIQSEESTEQDHTAACRLIELILLYCRGTVDMYVPHFINFVFKEILKGQYETTEFRVHSLEVIINCLYYNPELTLHILEQEQWTQGFFNLWFSNLDIFARVHDKKLVIVALCSLLTLSADKIPVSLQSGWSQILISISHVFKTLPQAIENRQEIEREYNGEEDESQDEEEDDDAEEEGEAVEGEEGEEEEGEEEEDNEEEEEEGEEEGDDDDDEEGAQEEDEDGDVEDEDAEYLEFLAQQALRQDDETAQDNEGLAEELMAESPLDAINPYECFEQVFRGLQQNQPDLYAHLTKDLDAEHQNNIMYVLAIAEDSRNELSVV